MITQYGSTCPRLYLNINKRFNDRLVIKQIKSFELNMSQGEEQVEEQVEVKTRKQRKAKAAAVDELVEKVMKRKKKEKRVGVNKGRWNRFLKKLHAENIAAAEETAKKEGKEVVKPIWPVPRKGTDDYARYIRERDAGSNFE